MHNFIINNPTKIYFGKNVVDGLGEFCRQYKSNALILYGKGSVKKNGILDKVLYQLQKEGKSIFEYSGIKPNPVVSDVASAAEFARNNNIDLIVAVGGGSVIDSAKILSLCIKENNDPWKVMKGRVRPKTAVPLVSVLTLAATGTEMNPYAVLQNTSTQEKIGYGNNLIYPAASYLDPEFTYSVPADQTAYGMVDLIAHTLEAYFGSGSAPLSDEFVFSIIRETINVSSQVLANPENYEYRARVMWAATCALNGLTSYGRDSSDWGVHDIGHTLSMLYDIPHGASLSIAYLAWMEHFAEELSERLLFLGINVFGREVEKSNDTILKFKEFFKSVNAPVSLREYCPNADSQQIISLMCKNKISGYVHKLSDIDYTKIVNIMFNN